jgi:uncharacterized BrkB/YihY/UPF0761 family membrane protein
VRVERSDTRVSILLWLGVLAPPLAWAALLVVGYAAEEADCSRGSGSFDGSHPVAVWTSVGAGVVALLSLLAATWLWRATRDRWPDARGRIPFMATLGVLTGLIFLALIVLTAVGVTHFDPCRPG